MSNFIVLEGVDGCGKTLQTNLLHKALYNSNISHKTTREPGGTSLAEELRHIILKYKHHPIIEAIIFSLSRMDHINKVILPSIHTNTFTISDRYFLSTLIYQGILNDIDLNYINKLHKNLNNNLQPDLTIIIDASKSYNKRISKRNNGNNTLNVDDYNHLDKSSQIYSKLMHESYMDSKKIYPYKSVIVNGEQHYLKIHAQIIKTINDMFNTNIIPITEYDI